jgi:hypothetical protein
LVERRDEHRWRPADGAVSLDVAGGSLNTMLGDASHANMTPIPASTFTHPDAHIRMWFGGKDGTTFEKLVPDRPLGSVPYAMMAETVPDGSLTGKKLARESVWPQHEGRPGDCIVTYYAEYTGASVGLSTNMPADRNFIITDVVCQSLSVQYGTICDVDIRYTRNA